VIDHAQAFDGDPSAALRALSVAILTDEAPVWEMAECSGVRATEILLNYVRELARRFDRSGQTGASEEAQEDNLRGLRAYGEAARASRQRGPVGQFSGEHSNALHSLSRVLAQHAGTAWIAHRRQNATAYPLLTHGEPARVGRLRAYGNAIVPHLAAEVIAAFMETRP
jgi:hypothetical protein